VTGLWGNRVRCLSVSLIVLQGRGQGTESWRGDAHGAGGASTEGELTVRRRGQRSRMAPTMSGISSYEK
jgi:hypothetical protein